LPEQQISLLMQTSAQKIQQGLPNGPTSFLLARGKADLREASADHPLQKLMSRTGSFPLHVPMALLNREAPKGGIILDPFCGKGTTLLAARLLGHNAFGSDIAPEAVICARAKMAPVTFETLARYLKSLEITHDEEEEVPDTVKVFFDEATIVQLLAVRRQLLVDCRKRRTHRTATFALGILLGILHGHATYSLSISSAHAYSMAPSYVKKYAQKHGLVAPRRDVIECILQKAKHLLGGPKLNRTRYAVKQGSATEISSLFPELIGKVDVLLTSPPYLNAQTYGKDNWLRQWLLGFDYRSNKKQYLQTSSTALYLEKMKTVLREFYKMLCPGGRLILVAGDVRTVKFVSGLRRIGTFETARALAGICREIGFVNIEDDDPENVESSSRYYHALNGNVGQSAARRIERAFTATKV
jgi:methylase of polypeptide subunit release factors